MNCFTWIPIVRGKLLSEEELRSSDWIHWMRSVMWTKIECMVYKYVANFAIKTHAEREHDTKPVQMCEPSKISK